ncbi:LPXTG cell wall anchor domain-containing protein [Curtobacterium sp. BRB10]|uniref:LPXTG cell wall anchor domain-containing protein n=1 Tax=Curtobacterium sp. BRB10 TaxID=2962579 RepID=UPI0037BE38D1
MSLIEAASSCATATTDCQDTLGPSTGDFDPLVVVAAVVVVAVAALVGVVLRRRRRR